MALRRSGRAEIDFRDLIEKIKKVPGGMGAGLKELVHQEARLFINNPRDGGIVGNTPPANAGNRGIKAKKQGEAAVLRDIYRIYATPKQAMEAIKKYSELEAKFFWKMLRTGQYKQARQIVQKYGGPRYKAITSVAAFDNGTMHDRFRSKNGRVQRDRVMMVVTDAKPLRDYVKTMQGKVGLLASGWTSAAGKLGVKLPAWITRHGTKWGGITIEAGQDRMVILISNHVPYGVENDLQRRVNYVLKYRKAALKRRLPYVIRAAMKKAGLQTGQRAA